MERRRKCGEVNDKTVVELMCAYAWEGKIDVLKDLLAIHPKEVNSPNQRGQTPLYCASRQGHLDIVVVLVLGGADPNFQVPDHGGTCLHAAAFGDFPSVVAALLLSGANPDIQNWMQVSAREEAKGKTADVYNIAEADSSELYKFHESLSKLPNLYCSPQVMGAKLCLAAWKGDLDAVNHWLQQDCGSIIVDYVNERGQTGLYCSAHQGHVEVVVSLIMAGANVNFQIQHHGGTPLHAASFGDHPAVIAALLLAGADTSLTNRMKLTARQEAKSMKVIQVFEWFDEKLFDEMVGLHQCLGTLKSGKPPPPRLSLSSGLKKLRIVKTLGSDRKEKEIRTCKSERILRPDILEGTEGERTERTEKPEMLERPERPERLERLERPEKPERPERLEKPERPEWPQRGSSGRPERPRNDAQGRPRQVCDTSSIPARIPTTQDVRRRSSSLGMAPPKPRSPFTDSKKRNISREEATEKTEDLPKINEPPEVITLTSWFEYLVGNDEDYFAKNKEEFIRNDGDGYLSLVNSKTRKQINAGQFNMVSIADLLLCLGPRPNKPPSGLRLPPIEIITATDPESRRFVDVGYLQSLPENRDAVFQVASNFNGVEGWAETVHPDSRWFTTNYYSDRTQGPAASISCGGGAITRVYAPFYNPRRDPSTWCQTKTTQLNFLENLPKYFPTKNGYVVYDGTEAKFPKKDGKKWKKLLVNYLVGYHKSQQVCFGHRLPLGFEVVKDENQVVDQVFCAAVNMCQGGTGVKNEEIDKKGEKAGFILQASYCGTYLSSICNKRKKLFLTLIGGGAFGNTPDRIVAEMVNAHCEWTSHPQNTIEKVVLVLFCAPPQGVDPWLETMKAQGVPYSYVEYSKGIPTVVKTHYPYK
eukprot:TRINITY_DN4681_c1_g3_i1.p1 TRINITY_DN4681_c1_g3~~TRINITY_DN4681_c1_g3_i1.p1  ORF type:complete len:879 (+),score=136.53 TRINITY_DN4681_c1_g3_i1:23-2638(+)